MKALYTLIRDGIHAACEAGKLPAEFLSLPIELERPNIPSHGDFSTSIALQGAKIAKLPPQRIAALLVPYFSTRPELVSAVEVAGPGFINFRITARYWIDGLSEGFTQASAFGRAALGKGRALVEFVSANPTGPLHIGHGRGAVVGDVMASVLDWAGYTVDREYYLNDGGVQMTMLGASIAARYDELQGVPVAFPEKGYRGDYIRDIAKRFLENPAYPLMTPQARTEAMGIDGGRQILTDILDDLAALGIRFDGLFRESSLYTEGRVEAMLALLDQKGLTYEKDGALWFATSRFGDDKDRVLRKSDGTYTYFTPDIAYHYHKLERGYDRFVDVWGADHGGYVPRMRAALKALGVDEDRLQVLLIQMVHLIAGGEKVNMSTRAGEFEELATVRQEAGKDATRYFFLMRSHQAHLDFDLDLAKTRSAENPVYYIQYAHARICSICRKADTTLDAVVSASAARLASFGGAMLLPEEVELIKAVLAFPETIVLAAAHAEPHRPAFYLLELARLFQTYYSRAREDKRYQVLQADAACQEIKLAIVAAVGQTLRNGLLLLGISAPQEM